MVKLCKFNGAGLQCSNIYISTDAIVLQNESCNIDNLLLKFNMFWLITLSLQWCHNELDGVSNQQSYECLLMRLCRRRSKKTSKLCVTGICEGNSPVTGEFPTQRASKGENVSIWCRHHDCVIPQNMRHQRSTKPLPNVTADKINLVIEMKLTIAGHNANWITTKRSYWSSLGAPSFVNNLSATRANQLHRCLKAIRGWPWQTMGPFD